MAKYSDIKGFTVQTLSTDTVASQIAGGSWSAGGSLPGARDETTGGGTLTAGILFGGYDPPGTAYKAETFEYNGTAWTEGGDMSNARNNFGGLGTQTAALAVGGQNPALSPAPFSGSEEYDGSSWTTGGALPGGFDSNYGCTGTQTAGLMVGGAGPGGRSNLTLSYNGTSWSDTGHNTPAVQDRNGATGPASAALSGGGRKGPAPSGAPTNNFNYYNGSTWTSITNYPTSGYHFHMQGPFTDTIVSGGFPLNTNANWWDGTSWTTAPSMSNNHGQAAKANSTAGATSGDGFVAGADPSGFNGTEHWNSAPSVFNQITEGQLYFNSTTNSFKETLKDFTAGTWSSANGLNNGRTGVSGARNTPGHGTGLAMAGFTTPPLTARGYTEEYDGTSWTEETDANQSRGQTSGTGTSSTAGLLYGGETYPSPANVTSTETWNGSSWTEVNELNVAGRGMGNCGTTIAALAIAGTPEGTGSGDRGAKTEVWDGTSWTESGDIPSIPNGLSYNCAFGTTTAATTTGGGPGPAGYKRKAWSWTGSSWTETTENNSDKTGGMAFGSSADSGYAMVSSTTEFWNGTAWTESADQSTGKTEGGTGGVSDSGLAFGGNNANTTTTEEFDVSLANKTITAS